MPIPLPNLDDRRWADLVEQGRALIPLYAPEWTDHNASDPGITLMELLAWIAEMDVYRVNRITDRQKRRLLALLQVRPEPPRPATVVAELRLDPGSSPAPAPLPASSEFAGSALDGSALMLRSISTIELMASEIGAVQRKDEGGFRNATAAWRRREPIPIFGDDPHAGHELYLGFTAPLRTGAWAQLYFQLAGDKAGPAERRRLQAATSGSGRLRHHSARVVWEYFTSAGGASRWLPLESDEDTRAFTLSGAVRLRPAGAMTARMVGVVTQPLYYVRCRYSGGTFDEAPRAVHVCLNGVELVQSVPVWQTWTIAAGATVSGTPVPGQQASLHFEMQQGAISTLTVDSTSTSDPRFWVLGYVAPTAQAPGRLTVEAALVGTGAGVPDQLVTVPRRPLIEHTFRLYSLEGADWRPWEPVDDFSASDRRSAHVLLDPAKGEVTFGNGEKGRTPPEGCLLVATYESTQADAGVSQVTGLADSPRNRVLLPDPGVIARLTATQRIELEAGRPAETLAHAIGRAIESREARLRAITVEDYESIALDTPGTRVARAIARPNLYPGLDCVTAPGVVSVIVVPSLPVGQPLPSEGLKSAVAARLERRRAIGTRVIVTGPRYLEVAVRVRLRAFDGVDKARLSRQVSDGLDAFFNPLTGGPTRTGWPLGRDVFRAEVMQVIDETPGVDHVLSLELIVEGCAPTCGNVCVRPTSLVAAGRHQIEAV